MLLSVRIGQDNRCGYHHNPRHWGFQVSGWPDSVHVPIQVVSLDINHVVLAIVAVVLLVIFLPAGGFVNNGRVCGLSVPTGGLLAIPTSV